MFDFNKYDDIVAISKYDGFIDPNGFFYRVTPQDGKGCEDTHNEWAKNFIEQKLNIKDFKFNPTTSALFTLTTLNGPASILINCFGYVYYSHDPFYYKPIIKLPNPKIGNHKTTEEQLDTLFSLMICNKENTNISIFNNDTDEFDYSGLDNEFIPIKKK